MHNCTRAWGERSMNGFRESCEAVHTGDEDVGHATILPIRQARKPELRPLRFVQPQAEKFLFALEIHADGHEHREAVIFSPPTEAGALAITALRATDLNGRWNGF